MTEVSEEDTSRKYFFLGIGINIWLYFLAFFTLLFGNLMPVIIFGIGGAAFIFIGMSDKIRKYEWHYPRLHSNVQFYNRYLKGYHFNV
jgi:hypothetical protein